MIIIIYYIVALPFLLFYAFRLTAKCSSQKKKKPVLRLLKERSVKMLQKPKILIIDSNLGVLDLLNEVVNTDREYSLFIESKKINAQDAVYAKKPDLILLCADSSVCLSTGEALLSLKECPPFVLMGKVFASERAAADIVKKFKPMDTITLPFELEEICQKIENDSMIAAGMIDELTELWKKPCFDFKLDRLMRKKTDGIFFCVSLNAYSFAANPSRPLQIQMAVFALKQRFPEALLGISGNIVLGFLPTDKPKKDFEKRINEVLSEMIEAAEKPVIFIPAGACESGDYSYSPEDMLLYADKAMEISGHEGKNRIKFYK